MTQQHLFMRMAGRAYACSASVDDHLHPHPAVPVEAADEVAGAGAKRDAVAPRAVRRAGGPAAVVAAGVHGHHVVHGGVVVELEDVPGAEALALGPAVRVEGPVDPVGGRVGDAEEEANGEQAAEGKPPRRTAPSLSHSDRRPELFLWALS